MVSSAEVAEVAEVEVIASDVDPSSLVVSDAWSVPELVAAELVLDARSVEVEPSALVVDSPPELSPVGGCAVASSGLKHPGALKHRQAAQHAERPENPRDPLPSAPVLSMHFMKLMM